MNIYLYGPPGSGKSSSGRLLAENLDLPFHDLDQEIETSRGMPIPEIFASEGEGAFRRMERQALRRLNRGTAGVIALGGGALLDPHNRSQVEASGTVFCLRAELPVLLHRLRAGQNNRPLLSQDLKTQLETLLADRQAHYASFSHPVHTARRTPQEVAWQIQIDLGRFRVSGMGEPYEVRIQNHILDDLGQQLQAWGLKEPLALVSDQRVASLYAERTVRILMQAGFECQTILLSGGEQDKNLQTVSTLWESFLKAGLDRRSTVIALGGGVVSDLAGFAAATYLRGIRWVALPASLLGMVDASLGGKTGIDLPQGKNLAGAFHPPSLVLSDPQLLATLDLDQMRNGMAEVLKHSLIGDPQLFECCAAGWKTLAADWETLVRRAAAVKIRVLLSDPYERGPREVLNFGHTIGHAIERASGYRFQHGQSVALGILVETCLAESLDLAEPGLSQKIRQALEGLGLPVSIPDWIDRDAIRQALLFDKKHRKDKARLALPVRVGEVRYGCEMDEEELWQQCLCCMDRT